MGVSGVLQNKIRQTDIEGLLHGLMVELAKLSPHPDRPEYTGPLFISSDSQFKPPAEYDGMLGSLMGESLLQSEFVSAAFDIVDAGTSFVQDRRPKSTISLGQKNTISRGFNDAAQREALMKAYLGDLGQRLSIESWIAGLQRLLYTTRKNELRLQLSYAA